MQTVPLERQDASASADAPGQIVFDSVEIDMGGRRLRVGGSEVALEPKAFDVLALLARSPGRAFARDEMLDAVWGHRHITPGVLNRIITLLRHALGESADAPRYLHTLHGIGYRFDAPVRFHGGRDEQRAELDASANASAALDLMQTSGDGTLKPVAAPSPMSREASGDGPVPLPARRLPWRAALLLALVAAAGAWLVVRQQPSTTPARADSPTLIVLPLRAVGGGHDESVLADGLSEELITRMARAEGLRVISSTSARLAQEQGLDPAALAERAGTTHALEGSLREAGEVLRVDLRLIETPSGRTIWAQDYDRKAVDILDVQREIAQAVTSALSARLGLAGNRQGKVDLAEYREYLQLRISLESPEVSLNAGGLDGPRHLAALTRLRELARRAPDNVAALGFLASVLARGRDPVTQAPLPGAIEEAQDDAARVLELDPANADAHAALGVLACRRMEWNACLAELKQAVALDPADVRLRGHYAYRLGAIGYVADAQHEAEIAARADPLVPATQMILARLTDTLGRHDEAKRLFDVIVKLDPAMPAIAAYAMWYNASWRGDYVDAEAIAARMTYYRDSYLAFSRMHGDPARWAEMLPLIEASEHDMGRYNFLRWERQGFDARPAFARLQTMLQEGFPSYFLSLWQPEYAHMRRDPEFQDFLKRTHILDYWRAHGFPPQCRPDKDGAACD